MKITQDVRDYAATLNDTAAAGTLTAEQGMAQMSKKFLDMGAEVYVEAEKAAAAKDANKAL